MQPKLLTLIFCLIVFASNAQDQYNLQLLNQKISSAKNDVEKIDAYSQLADYYSLFKLNRQSDSVLQKALSIAEISNDKDLILKSFFSMNVATINPWNSKETFERIINFIQKGLEYSRELKRDDYVAMAYIRLAGIYRKRQLYDEAIQQATQAFTALNDIDADSIKSLLYNELGDIFIAKGDVIPAYRNYENAFTIAYKSKNFQLQSEIYHRFSELYKSLGNDKMAEKNLKESMELNKRNNYNEGLLEDYIDLARLTDDSEYITRSAVLASATNSERYKEYSKRLMFYWYIVRGKNITVTLNFYYNNPTLGQYYKNEGNSNFYWNLGYVYLYGERYDSALYYFKMAEGELNEDYDNGIRLSIYSSLAKTYRRNNNILEAKSYYEKAFRICKLMNSLSSLPAISDSLSKLYENQSDYKMAYYYDKQADSCNKIIQENTAKDQVVLLQVDMENKKRESDLLDIEQKRSRKYNLQIMAITILIAGIFSCMLFIGMFKVSKATIKMLGYFAFISLFEFIVLLIDPFIIRLTDAEPLKIWGIKIFLIALLVPFQHFLEHGLIKFLSGKKLLEARQKFSIKNWWWKKKEINTSEDTDLEEDTAVL